jgi:histidine ammonia-lyase
VSLEIGPLDSAVEDHATNATEAARVSAQALDVLGDVLSVELLMARALLIDDETRPRLGEGTRQALDIVDRALADLDDDGPSGEAVAIVKSLIAGGTLASISSA